MIKMLESLNLEYERFNKIKPKKVIQLILKIE